MWTRVIKSSGGNDSIALCAWVAADIKKHGDDPAGVVVCHNDTGWGSRSWPRRVESVEHWCHSLGFDTHRTGSVGMEALILGKRGAGMPPMSGKAYCSVELKILPTEDWLDSWDHDCEATILIGKRRQESRARASTPGWIEGTGPVDWEQAKPDSHQRKRDAITLARARRRDIHHPLVLLSVSERDALLPVHLPSFAQVALAMGMDVARLPTSSLWAEVESFCAVRGWQAPYFKRSEECQPCIPYGGKADWGGLPENRIVTIESVTRRIRDRHADFTWRPPRRSGGARDVQELVEWGKSPTGHYRAEQVSLCDLGWCDVD